MFVFQEKVDLYEPLDVKYIRFLNILQDRNSNFLLLIATGSLALMASAGLIYFGIPQVFQIQEKENAIMYFGGIMVAGMIALVFLMLSTLVIWGGIQNLSL